MNTLDLILAGIVAFSVVTGFIAGFARVGVGFGATILGIFCGLWLYGIPAAWLSDYLGRGAASNLIGFFLVFAAVVIAGNLLGAILSRAFKWVGLSWLDRLIGAGFGFARGIVLVVAVVTVITAFAPNPPPRFMVHSKVLPYATRAGSVLAALAPHSLKEAYAASTHTLRRLWADSLTVQRRPEKMSSESY